MRRRTVFAGVFGFFLVFTLGCAVDQEKQAAPQDQTGEEKKAIKFLESKGVLVRWHVPRRQPAQGSSLVRGFSF